MYMGCVIKYYWAAVVESCSDCDFAARKLEGASEII